MVTRDRKVLITDSHLLQGHTYEVAVVARDRDGRMQSMDDAPKAVVSIGGRVMVPSPPTGLVATAAFHTVFLAWTMPADTDIDRVEVYRHTADDRASASLIATVKGTAYADDLGAAGLTRYYWVRLYNRSGVQSDWNAAAGVSATTAAISAATVDDYAITATKLHANIVVLANDSWTDNSPSPGYVAWNAHSIVYGGATYAIQADNTDYKYIYWTAGYTAYSYTNTYPAPGSPWFMIANNVAGVHTLVWNSSANMVIGSAWIADAAITNAKINDLSADKINAGTLTGRVVQTAASGQRVVIDSSDNTLKFYDSTGAVVLTITGATGWVGGGISIPKGELVVSSDTSIRYGVLTESNLLIKNPSGSTASCIALNTGGGLCYTTTISSGKTGKFYRGLLGTTENFYVEETGAITTAKVKITALGGVAILLTNRTGGNTVAGQVVIADTANNDAFKLSAATEYVPIGIVLDGGISNGSEAWVVVSGIADVAMKDNTAATRGYWVKTSSEAGYADATNAAPPGGGVTELTTHSQEIGHCIESVSAGGAGSHILARCVLHFN